MRSSECFDVANQQIWVHLWGCVLYNDYHQNIEKKYFNRPNFPFPSLSNNTMAEADGTEPFDRAWFGCCPSRRIPSDDNGIPTCSLNDVTRSAALGSPKQQVVENTDANSCTPFKITWAQISSEMLDLYSHSTWAPWFDHFCPTGTRFVDVLTWVFMIKWSRQNQPLARKDVRWYAPVKIRHGTCVHQQTIPTIHGTIWVPWCNGQYHWMCFKWAQNVFS